MRDMSPREEEYAAKGVEILAVNAFEPVSAGKAFIDGDGSDLDLHWAFADDAATEALGVKSVPTQILIDRDGYVIWASDFTTVAGGAEVVFAAIDALLESEDEGA